MSKDLPDPESVSAFIAKLEPEFASLIESIRQIILETDKEIAERIKWNSPCFYYTGPMLPFNPKEYKRDLIVLNVRKNMALLVFPTGAVIPDTTGVLEGNYTDGRRLIPFKTKEEVAARKNDLQRVIRQWLELVER
ncbi:MAG: DUF1801 domain-containing protein [Saprospiraceae bacterium]|jgi:uncharacterized protein YdhG (YjbR/CyaY superfamily)|nr:DUF1801 domain-containing protein [Saprospiraceae bacterium]